MQKNDIIAPMKPSVGGYVERLADDVLHQLMSALPALLLVGPRAIGKTTTALRHAETVVRLDRAAEAVAFEADPDAALRGLPEPVLLDEWQLVPGVLGAVKRAIDRDPRPGRFLVTGSVRADLEQPTWPGTGRLVRLPMYGLTQRELVGRAQGPGLIDRIAIQGPAGALVSCPDPPDLRDYVGLALRGGFPDTALRLDGRARRAWLKSYVGQLLTRDVALVDRGRDPDRLRRYLEALAIVSAQVVHDKTILEAAHINRLTAHAYEQLLRNLFVVDAVPAWTTKRLSQLGRSSKRFLVEPALSGPLLGVTVDDVMREGRLLGALLESFVVAQIRAEVALSDVPRRLFHLRTGGGRQEVDLLVDLGRGRMLAVEVKATAAPTRKHVRHLIWLRERLGDRFHAGVVLHTGPRAFELDAGIVATPIAALWSNPGPQPASTLSS